MSGSPKPSARVGTSGFAVEVEIPEGMFFEAKDYNPLAGKDRNSLDTQSRVAKYRAKKKQEIRLSLDDLDRINGGAHAADRQGNLAAHWDSMRGAAVKLLAQVDHMGKQVDAGDDRYDNALQDQPAAVASVAPGAVVPVRASLQSVKPTPGSLAAQVRRRSS